MPLEPGEAIPRIRGDAPGKDFNSLHAFAARPSTHASGLAKPMHNAGLAALLAAGTLTTIAALAHLACIRLGAPAYRFMGAGERMARAVEAGKLQPTLITLAIAGVLLVWALYAFSAARVIGELPGTGFVLVAVCVTFLLRALAFPLLKPAFPENSTTFWLVSSSICLVLGVLYAIGAISLWANR